MTGRYDPKRRRRQSLRLKGYDYTQAGAYFVTIVVQDGSCLFGEVACEEMRLNDAGEMVCRVWEALPLRFPGMELDMFVIMPNHVHGIVVIDTATADPGAGAPGVAPAGLGNVIGAYKSLTTVEYARGVKTMAWPPFRDRLWQRNYYEHVVRNDEALTGIREYIVNNPARWSFDRENPLVARPGRAG